MASLLDVPTPLYPRECFGREADPSPDGHYQYGTGGRHVHSVDQDRVAVVERAIAAGFDLNETATDSGLTPGVCWSVAVRIARPNALGLRRAKYDRARLRAKRLEDALTATLRQLQRLASQSTPELSDRVLAVVVALEDAMNAKGGAV